MNLQVFYDGFHKDSKAGSRILDPKNFTYRNLISMLTNEIPYLSDANRKLRILDYGCGVGSLAMYLSNLGHNVVGLDISPKAIKVAQETSANLGLQKKTKFHTLEVGLKKMSSSKFDLIICTEVIEHVDNEIDLIKSLSVQCKKNGYIFLTTPSTNSPLYKMGILKSFDERVGHKRRYTISRLKNLLNTNGFLVKRVIKSEGILRNSLYTLPHVGFLIKFLKGPISDIVTFIDNVCVPLFGEADLAVIALKP